MGQITLQFPAHMHFDDALPATIHVVGMDGIVSPGRISREGNRVTISRVRDESGHVYLAWPTDEFGEIVLVTGTIPEGESPVRVVIELARGTINRLRNQVSNWEEGGLEIPPSIREASDRAAKMMVDALMEKKTDVSDLSAMRAIEIAVKTIFELVDCFSNRIFPLRLKSETANKVWIGCATDSNEGAKSLIGRDSVRPEFDLCETTAIREVEGPACLGPLLDVGLNGTFANLEPGIPFESKLAAVLQQVKAGVEAIPPNVKMIHAISGLNSTGHRHLSYPQQLQVSLEVLQIIEDRVGQAPVLISFDNPWGERLARSVGGVHPLQIADTLLRRGVRISTLGLEVNLDYGVRGSFSRDPLQWLELLELWGQFGLPLVYLLRVPCGAEANAVDDGGVIRLGMSDAQRIRLVKSVLPLVLSRPIVHGIIWQQLQDNSSQFFPGAGLLDEAERAKEIYQVHCSIMERIRNSRDD